MALFTLYSSSAGSGKTFTLTREYLRLALSNDDPGYFRHILAMTFTNDAAEEMKQRIISALKEISSGSEKSSVLLEKLLEDLRHLSEDELRKRAKRMLDKVLQDYNDFAIKTIDSFVNQVISSFTFDLQLPYTYEIILETDELIAEAVRNLIDRVGDDAGLTEMFKEFALGKLDENQSWNTLEKDIIDFSKVIYRDNNAVQIARNIQLTYHDIREIRTKIRTSLKSMEQAVQEHAQKAVVLLDAHALSDADFFQGRRGIWNFYHKLSENPKKLWEKDGSRTARKTLEEDRWYKEKSPTADRVEEILPQLRELTSQILAYDTDKYRVLEAISKNLLKIPFLAAVKQETDLILAENDRAVLADFNRKILGIVSDEPMPYIYERIGEKYHHILVDEFQDTSDMQFFNLLPLFDNSVAGNYENLVVGDPKQAIYSWRGGNVMLMIDLITRRKDYLLDKAPPIQQERIDTLQNTTELKNLTTNFRSAEGIIAFNNALFSDILAREESLTLREVFQDVRQNTPPQPKTGGYTAIEVLKRGEDDPEAKLVARVQELIAEGYGLADLCVLCRKGKEGVEVAEMLERAGYPINSSEVLKVRNNREVQLLLSALRFARHPNRTFERFELLQFFFLLKQADPSNYDLEALTGYTPEGFLTFFSHFGVDLDGMASLDPYRLAEFFVAKFELMKVRNSADYLLAFLDYTLNFTQRRSKSLADLLDDWEVKKEKLAIPRKSANAITITTIHKAKGLEYPVVIMPYITWETTPQKNDQVWLSLDDLDYPELESSNGRIRSAPFPFSRDFDFAADVLQRERDLLLIENLNLLYVALTRAKERQYLWIWGKETKKGFSVEHIGEWLAKFLNPQEAAVFSEPVYEFGSKSLRPADKEEKPEPLHYPLRLPQIFQERPGPKIKWSAPDHRVREGNLVHAVFEKIKTTADLDPVINALKREGLLRAEEEELILSKVRSVVEHPDLAPLFAPDTHVKNEVDILSSHSRTQRPDRVVLLQDRAYIVDYKTGKRRSSHKKQLQEYARLLMQMLKHQPLFLFLVYFDPLEVVKVPSSG